MCQAGGREGGGQLGRALQRVGWREGLSGEELKVRVLSGNEQKD